MSFQNINLNSIGFYTLSNERVTQLSPTSPMWRCELILTDNCNFNCTYCRGLQLHQMGDMSMEQAKESLGYWIDEGLKNVRFSGGEPLLWKGLEELVEWTRDQGVERIAVSSNGSAGVQIYGRLVKAGVNDFSISLDACCSNGFHDMSQYPDPDWTKENRISPWTRIVENIKLLSEDTYVTVGVVLTEENIDEILGIISFAGDLGVDDIRIIPSAQWDASLADAISNGSALHERVQTIISRSPILRYRWENIRAGRHVRGIRDVDSKRCYFPIDDSVIVQGFHYPCVIYMREHGEPIGAVGPDMRHDRIAWAENHNAKEDPICKANCLDVCIDHNNRCSAYDSESLLGVSLL